MESDIKFGKKSNIMRKGLLFMIALMFVISSGYSTQIYVGDSNSLPTIPDNVFTKLILTSSFETYQESSAQDLILRHRQPIAQENLITIQVLNSLGNNTMFFTLSAPSFSDGFNLTQTQFNLSPSEQQVFGILTTHDNEEFEARITCTSGCNNITDNGYKVVTRLSTRQEATLSQSTNGFIEALIQVIDINVTAWVILFYAFLFVITLAFTLLVFGLGFLTFKYAKRLKKQREEGVM